MTTIQDIQAVVGRRFGVTVLDLCSSRRGQALAQPQPPDQNARGRL